MKIKVDGKDESRAKVKFWTFIVYYLEEILWWTKCKLSQSIESK